MEVICCRMCPIFQVSNVTGENLSLLRMFLNLLSTRMPCDYAAPAEFQIDETFAVPVCTLPFAFFLFFGISREWMRMHYHCVLHCTIQPTGCKSYNKRLSYLLQMLKLFRATTGC